MAEIESKRYGVDLELTTELDKTKVLKRTNFKLTTKLDKAMKKLDRVKREITDMGDLYQNGIKESVTLKLNIDQLTSERDAVESENQVIRPQLESTSQELGMVRARLELIEGVL